MKKLILLLGFFTMCSVASAEMVSGDSIGNDPEKAKLCASRAKVSAVPFEIDSQYVKRVRAQDPDATFIASDGISPQLIQCQLLTGSGKFGPSSMSPEQGYWHLPRPKQHAPGINTSKGMAIAANVCLDAVPTKISRPNFDHIVYSAVLEIAAGSPKYHPGAKFAEVKADRYDVAVLGSAFYKSSGVDLLTVNFTCLLSPMFELRTIELK